MYNLSLFFSFSSRMFEPTFSLFRHFVYLDLSRNLVPRSSHSLRLSRHFEYISILVGNFGHVILLCARVFSRAAAILKSEKTLGTRLGGGEHSNTPGTFFVYPCSNDRWRHIRSESVQLFPRAGKSNLTATVSFTQWVKWPYISIGCKFSFYFSRRWRQICTLSSHLIG